jgi:pantoate--beta-alanine ligase
MTKTLETISAIQSWVSSCRKRGLSVGFVPTMGAFHEGHLTLMREARRNNGAVVVSIFVNPIQFTAGEDFDRYPRRLEQDTKMAESEGVDVIFSPSVAEMYPKGFDTYVDMDEKNGLQTKLCGEYRPGHFRGVMTIVTKLFNIVKPDTAYFGQKDYQQWLIVRRIAVDLNLDVAIKVMPTVREEDGVAMSSRNLYLGPKQRNDASCLIESLRRAEDLVNGGESSAARVASEMRKLIHKVKGTRVEYIGIVNSETLEPVKEIKGKTLIALAVRIGKTRLIDNVIL